MEIDLLLRGSQADKPDVLANRLIALLKETGPITRPEMVERLGLPRTTLFDALTRLRRQKIICSYPVHAKILRERIIYGKKYLLERVKETRGRPKTLFALVA